VLEGSERERGKVPRRPIRARGAKPRDQPPRHQMGERTMQTPESEQLSKRKVSRRPSTTDQALRRTSNRSAAVLGDLRASAVERGRPSAKTAPDRAQKKLRPQSRLPVPLQTRRYRQRGSPRATTRNRGSTCVKRHCQTALEPLNCLPYSTNSRATLNSPFASAVNLHPGLAIRSRIARKKTPPKPYSQPHCNRWRYQKQGGTDLTTRRTMIKPHCQ